MPVTPENTPKSYNTGTSFTSFVMGGPGMHVQSHRAKELDDYIDGHPDCKLEKSEPYEIHGKRTDLSVYRLPLSYLVYNIRNGRFAAELKELEAELGKVLNPEDVDDSKRIEDLLLKDKNQAKFIKKDIARVGQLRPGAISYDGTVIDGNRRVAVLRDIHEETLDEKFNYFETVRLPTNVSAEDLWRIEAGIQLSYDLKAAYGPINELLKIKEGLDASLSHGMIAVVLGGDNTIKSVKEKEQRLVLIEDYLNYLGRPFKYSVAERRHEHFIDLQNVMGTPKFKKLTEEDRTRLIHAAYDMIRAGLPHLDIRKLRRVIEEHDVVESFLEETQDVVKPRGTDTIDELEPEKILGIEETSEILQDLLDDDTSDEVDEDEDTDDIETTKPEVVPRVPSKPIVDKNLKKDLQIALENAVDRVDTKKQRRKPQQLLRRAKGALITLSELEVERTKPLIDDLSELAEIIESILLKLKE